MVIKFTTSLVGHGFHYDAGDVTDLPNQEAKRLVVAGFAEAEPVRTVEDIETAELTHDTVEKATLSDADLEQADAPKRVLKVKHRPLPPRKKATA